MRVHVLECDIVKYDETAYHDNQCIFAAIIIRHIGSMLVSEHLREAASYGPMSFIARLKVKKR